jgi:hypothetical protein
MKVTDDVRQYLATIGRKGGRNGRGVKKNRPDGYYREIALKAAAVRKKKRLAREQKRV